MNALNTTNAQGLHYIYRGYLFKDIETDRTTDNRQHYIIILLESGNRQSAKQYIILLNQIINLKQKLKSYIISIDNSHLQHFIAYLRPPYINRLGAHTHHTTIKNI